MTTSTYKTLEPYKTRLGYTKTVGYGRFDRQELAVFFQAYKETFGTELTRAQKGCPHCIKKALTALYDELEKFEKCPAGRKYLKEKKDGLHKV